MVRKKEKKITDEEFEKFIKTYYIQLLEKVYEFNGGDEEKENSMESSSYHTEECMMGNVSDFIDEVRAEK
tara:strand:+ start:340 stop:549 length:210 start_codon:yes stop_codon:yes gene_type:complete